MPSKIIAEHQPPQAGTLRSPQLVRAVEEAQLLLAFAARNGIALGTDIVETVVKAKSDDRLSEEEEGVFWSQFNRLAQTVSPVTAESLRAMHGHPLPSNGWTWPWTRWCWMSQARRTVLSYTFVAVISLVVLLVFQYFWAQGTYLAQDIQRIEKRYKVVETQIKTIEKLPQDGQKEKDVERYFLGLEKTALLQQKNTDMELIKNWRNKLLSRDVEAPERAAQSTATASSNKPNDNKRISRGNPATESQLPAEQAYVGLLQKLILELEAIQGYILPLLYGLLGACVYILRTLSTRIKTNTYTEISNINLKIRLFLGMLGGMVIAWFVTPENSSGIFKSLSPFALAFLAGYSIELLFASMDRIIGAFTGNASASSDKAK